MLPYKIGILTEGGVSPPEWKDLLSAAPPFCAECHQPLLAFKNCHHDEGFSPRRDLLSAAPQRQPERNVLSDALSLEPEKHFALPGWNLEIDAALVIQRNCLFRVQCGEGDAAWLSGNGGIDKAAADHVVV